MCLVRLSFLFTVGFWTLFATSDVTSMEPPATLSPVQLKKMLKTAVIRALQESSEEDQLEGRSPKADEHSHTQEHVGEHKQAHTRYEKHAEEYEHSAVHKHMHVHDHYHDHNHHHKHQADLESIEDHKHAYGHKHKYYTVV